MPGPPPPSKSYLLKFDSSSDEDDDDGYYRESKPARKEIRPETHLQPQPIANPNADLFQMLKSLGGRVSTSTESPNNDAQTTSTSTTQTETESSIDAASTASATKNKNKKKKKRKKKKKKSGSATAAPAPPKKVSFSKLHVAEFERDIHANGVPYDGGWPLGLSNNLQREFSLDIDEFETNKQIELKSRYEQYVTSRRIKKHRGGSSSSSHSRRKRSHSKTSEELKKEVQAQKDAKKKLEAIPIYIPENHLWETRQFDYRKSYSDKLREEGKDPKLEFEEICSTGKNILFTQLSESDRKYLLTRDVTQPSSSSSDELYCSQEIKHIRNDLEQIRIHRSADNAAGCSCRKLQVPLPSDLNTGGKKSHHRRLTERRVKDELRRRHIAFESRAKREDLEQLLHDAVEKNGCCYGNDCPCARNGIVCQQDTCSCWHMSHTTHKKDHIGENDITPAEAKERCGNSNGIYVVDFDRIAKHRSLFITNKSYGLCTEISS